MAVISKRAQIFPASAFIQALDRAKQSVVRVAIRNVVTEERAEFTGWFLTPDLVLLPGFPPPESSPRDDRGTVRMMTNRNQVDWDETVVDGPEYISSDDGQGLALCRVPTSRPQSVRRMSISNLEVGDVVSVFQYPGASELAVSFGRVVNITDSWVDYDADTLPGSSGAPVLNDAGDVVAMHVSRKDHLKLGNRGILARALVETLQRSRSWPEIARAQQFADVVAGRETVKKSTSPGPYAAWSESTLLRAAVLDGIDKLTLTAAEQEQLRSYVVDATKERWMLTPAARIQALASAGSMEALLQARGTTIAGTVAQKVIDRVLAGPPYRLDDADEETLSWWIQVSRWFAGVAPSLPPPATILRALERRRVRSRLGVLAGSEFAGRAEELTALRDWYHASAVGPFSLSGIGGIGKSALVARFASELPADTLLLWLDFDRADLAPDDAASILAAIAQQAAVQLDGFSEPPIDRGEWPETARALADAIAQHVGPTNAPLLVLDSFEVAQYSMRYQELWPVLEAFATSIPSLRVVITGRAQVETIELGGRRSLSKKLTGLGPQDARGWLNAHGIAQPDVADAVLRLAGGVPLILKLAERLVDNGGRIQDLPQDLPREIVAGYLYDRILDRVQNGALKPVATAALVLRRLELNMIGPVFAGVVDLPEGDPALWFDELKREKGLVEGIEVLRLRPEVRAATLKLLEGDKPDLVRTMDKRAEQYYAAQARTSDDPEIAAELVYHRLRLGDFAGAEAAWRDGSGAFLMYAADEIPVALRGWLEARLGAGQAPSTPLRAWEAEAAERIRALRARKRPQVIRAVLEERPDRSDDSPLYFEEAFERRSSGDHAGALDVLSRAPRVKGAVQRDRDVLEALLRSEANERARADDLLAGLSDPALWSECSDGSAIQLALVAARLRLTVDVGAEASVATDLGLNFFEGCPVLAPVDAVLPTLRDRLLDASQTEHTGTFNLTEDPAWLRSLAAIIETQRRLSHPNEHGALSVLRSHLDDSTYPHWRHPLVHADPSVDPELLRTLTLARSAWRRWWLVTRSPFLARAYAMALNPASLSDALTPPILGSLALFASPLPGMLLVGERGPIFDVLFRSLWIEKSTFALSQRHVADVTDLFSRLQVAPPKLVELLAHLFDGRTATESRTISGELLFGREDPFLPVLLYMLSPDPLAQLAKRLAGLVAWEGF